MVGDKLAVEQHISARFHPRDQPSERQLGGIVRAAEHAFAKKSTAQRQAIKPANQPWRPPFGQRGIVPHLDAMGVAERMEDDERLFNEAVNPCRRPVGRARRTFGNYRAKSGIARHPIKVRAHQFAQGFREMKAIQGQYPARLWLDPINILCRAIIRHRKNPHRISAQ